MRLLFSRPRVLLGILLAFIGGLASALSPSEPRTVDVPVYGGAFDHQSQPALALGGTGGLAVWNDARGGIYGARLDANHQLLDPGGIPLQRGGIEPEVAWNGQHYLVVFARGTSVEGLRVAPSGQVLDAAPIVIASAAGSQQRVDVAALGSDFLVVWQHRREDGSGINVIRGARVNAGGQVLEPGGWVLSEGPTLRNSPSVTAGGGRWFVTWEQEGGFDEPTRVRATWVTPEGTVTHPAGLTVSPDRASAGSPAAAFDGTRFWVAWEGGTAAPGAIHVTRVNPDGTVQDPNGIRVYSHEQRDLYLPNIACGDVCAVVWMRTTGTVSVDVEAARVALDGTVLTAPGSAHLVGTVFTDIPSTRVKRAGIAAAGGSVAFAWSGLGPPSQPGGRGSDIHGRRLLGDGGWQEPESLRVSTSANPQTGPAVAFNGSHYLAVWLDARGSTDRDVDVYGARFDTTGTQVGPAVPISLRPQEAAGLALASDGTDFLAVWEDRTPDEANILGARISAAGELLDSQGIPISTAAGAQRQPRVSFDGTSYVVTWQDGRIDSSGLDIYAARVSPQGQVLDPAGIPVATGTRLQVRPDIGSAPDAGVSLIVWEEAGNGADLFAARFLASDGSLAPTLHVADAGPMNTPRVVHVQGEWLLAWSGASYLEGSSQPNGGLAGGRLRSATDGGVDPFTLLPEGLQRPDILSTRLVSDGDNALLVWLERHPSNVYQHELRASYLSPQGTPLTPQPVRLSSHPSNNRYATGFNTLGAGAHGPRSFLTTYPVWQAVPYGSFRLAVRTLAPAPRGSTCSADVECASGFCADGVCCDSACGGSDDSDCQACSVARGAAVNGTCAPAVPGTQCRAAAGACDAAEACDGTATSCPADADLPDGASCDDTNACTRGDQCQAGACVSGSPVVCSAQDACHDVGTCNPATGLCSNPVKADGSTCDDSNACTTVDRCQAGACTGGTPVTCRASDACHAAGTCDPATGVCSNPERPNGTACNDGNACTRSDTCQAGACTGSSPVVCAAASACHDVGTCNPATGACSSPVKPDGAACNDANACTQVDSCRAGACVGSDPVTCTASDACHAPGTCNPATGVCSNPPRPNGTACDDGNACTRSDACQAGACMGGGTVTCTAQDACHDVGTCDPATGACSNPVKPDGTACSDGSACTTGDVCTAGACGGRPPACDPAPECQARVCTVGNLCGLQPVADGTPCTAGTCRSGACVAEAPDAGSEPPDAGSGPGRDAGTGEGGGTPPPEGKGCGCTSGADLFPLAGMLVFLRRRARRQRR